MTQVGFKLDVSISDDALKTVYFYLNSIVDLSISNEDCLDTSYFVFCQ